MNKLILVFSLIIGTGWAQSTNVQNQTALIRSSQFIFEGTVKKLHASNVKLLAPSDQTILVRVDSMLRAPKGMSFSGKDVTLYLQAGSEFKPGQRAVFFTNGWLYGENMAMRSVGQLPSGAVENLKANIPQVDAQTADEALLVRLRNADFVIEGKVIGTKPAREENRRRSEHETGWAVADVQITAILKGQSSAGGKLIHVFFPTSTDELWYLSPRFSTGHEGTFILSSRAAKQYGLDGYTALDPLDFRPLKERERVQRLVRGVR